MPAKKTTRAMARSVPGDPNTVYISTQYDPRDSSGATTTTWREIYKGVTATGGASWTWTPITSGSSVNNLRPIVPAWDADHTALVWFRGTYTSAQNTDAAVVGIIDQHDTQSSLVHYVDATTLNTTRDTGAAIGASGPSSAEGSPAEVAGAGDNLWHWRTGVGNGNGGVGDVLAAGATDPEAPLAQDDAHRPRRRQVRHFWLFLGEPDQRLEDSIRAQRQQHAVVP